MVAGGVLHFPPSENSTSVRGLTAGSEDTAVHIEDEASCDFNDELSLKCSQRAGCKCGIDTE